MVHCCLYGLHPTWSNLSRRLQPHIPEWDSGQSSWGLWQYRVHIHHLEIGHLPLQLPVCGTTSRSHFMWSSLHDASRETWRHFYITLLSFFNIFHFLFFKMLGALILTLGYFNFWLSLSLSDSLSETLNLTLSWLLKSGLRPKFHLTLDLDFRWVKVKK